MMQGLSRAWENDAWQLDIIVVAPIAVGISAACAHMGLVAITNASLRLELYATVAAVFASLLGFNITSVSILALISESKALSALRHERPAIYARLIDTFRTTILAAIVAMTVSLAGLLSPETYVAVNFIVLDVVIYAALYGTVRLCRSVARLFEIISL